MELTLLPFLYKIKLQTHMKKIQLHLLLLITGCMLLFSCNNETKNTALVNTTNKDTNAAVQVTLEGKTHTITQDDLEAINVSFDDDILQFTLYQEGNPFQLNLNLNNTGLLTKGSESYKIPDANAMKTKVDLNFFNADRDVKSMNKRIIFRKANIEIKQFTKHKLEMTFEGEGSGMMERDKNFPISGKVNITY